MSAVLAPLFLIVAWAAGLAFMLRRRNAHLWLSDYVRRRLPARRADAPIHVMFCFVDHFEPKWGGPSAQVEAARVQTWCERYAAMASQHVDSDGVHPQHTFFYPEEEYEREHLDRLAELCARGYGEIEVHLHHDNDTAEGLREKLEGFCTVLHERHGALSRSPEGGLLRFGFIHGNWALDNSRPDGRWCGVNNEISVLAKLGCYADFTMPSAPSDTQTRKVNSIYYAVDDPQRPRSHDFGIDARVGAKPAGDLMIVQGPLALNWRRRKWAAFPRIENADVRASNPPTTDRVDLWIRQGIHVRGREDWLFVKVHTHGAQEGDMETLLGDAAHRMYEYLARRYGSGDKWKLHYVTARELFNIVRAAEHGATGNPHQYRDYEIPRPRASRSVDRSMKVQDTERGGAGDS